MTRAATATRAAVTDPVEALLRDVLAEQARQAGILAEILRALDRGHGPRDAADVALLVAIAEAIGDRTFTAAQLVTHSHASSVLRDALEAADITNARDLGWVCRRVEGRPLSGLVLERDGDARAGVLWRVRVSESQHRVP